MTREELIIAANIYAQAVEEDSDCDSSYYQNWLEDKLEVPQLFMFLDSINNFNN